jgi:hypothetical protein
MEDLVHDPDLGKGEWALVQTFVEESDLAGIEAIEVADGGDGIGDCDHGASCGW